MADLFICDTNNNRIVKRDADTLAYISQVGSLGSGIDEFNAPQSIDHDGTYIYIADQGNGRIVKRLASDLSYVSSSFTFLPGDEMSDVPSGICVDGTGTYVYYVRPNYKNIVKILASDLSFDSYIFASSGPDYLYDISYDKVNDLIFITASSSFPDEIHSYSVSPLSFNSSITLSGDSAGVRGCFVSGSLNRLYFVTNDSDVTRFLRKRDLSFSEISAISTFNGADVFNIGGPWDVTSDGTHLYVADNSRIIKFLESDLSYISEVGTLGSGNDQFDGPKGIVVGASSSPPAVAIKTTFGNIIW
jgi:DNA-binding beta-propeller fold protein YncE